MIDLDITLMPLVFIDVETTGFSPSKCRMIEVAAIRVENGEAVDKLVSFLKIDCALPPFITELTGITDDDLKDAPLFADVAPKLTKIMDGAILVAHNAKFDYSFIKAEFERIQLPFTAITLCTCEMARTLYPAMPNHKLGTLIEQFKFEAVERHRAEDDASVLIQFVTKCKDEFGLDRVRSVAQGVLV